MVKHLSSFLVGTLFSFCSIFATFAQTQTTATENDVAKKVVVPAKISGRWISPQASQSFSLENIVVNGNDISGKVTIWAVGDNSCNVIGKSVTGVIQESVATFRIVTPCHSDYVAIFNFEKKSGTYTRGSGGGRYEFN